MTLQNKVLRNELLKAKDTRNVITSANNAFNTVVEFVDGLPADFLKEALDKHSNEFYGIEISVEAFKSNVNNSLSKNRKRQMKDKTNTGNNKHN